MTLQKLIVVVDSEVRGTTLQKLIVKVKKSEKVKSEKSESESEVTNFIVTKTLSLT